MKLYEYRLRVVDESSDKFKALKTAAVGAESKVEGVRQKLKGCTKASDEFNSSLRGLKMTLATAFSITALAAVATNIFNVGTQAEQTRIAYGTLVKDVKVTSQLLTGMQKFADKSPFSTKEVLDAGQSLLGFGIANQKLLPIMKMLGDASLGNAEKFKSLVDNYGKLNSAQRANTVDLNQFAIAGIPIWEELGKVVGKQGAELRKFVEKNGVSVGTVNTIFQRLTSKGGLYFNAMNNQMKSTNGKWSNFLASIERRMVQVFNAAQPIINLLIDFGTILLDNTAILKQIGVAIGVATMLFASYKAGVLGVLIVQKAYAGAMIIGNAATLLFTKGFAGLNTVMRLNPVGLIVTGIVALGAALIYAYNKVDWFRGGLWGLWESAKTIFSNIGDFFKKTFEPIFEAVNLFRAGKWGEAASALGKGAVNIATITPRFLLAGIKGDLTKGVADSWKKGYANGVKAGGLELPDWLKGVMGGSVDGAGAGGANTSGALDTAIQGGINDTISGGHKATTINISVGKFVEKIEAHYADSKESMSDLEQAFLQMFNRVLAGANYAGGQ